MWLKESVALAQLVGVRTFYRIAQAGLLEECFKMQPEELCAATGIKRNSAERITSFDNWEKIEAQLEVAQKEGIEILLWNDSRHPYSQTSDVSYPPVLYIKGGINPELFGTGIAIVGTRKPTDYGARISYSIAEAAAKRGIVVVSGLALGIDAEAHRGALDANGVTWAVLGSGADQPYPQQNVGLYHKIVDKGGAILSFFPVGTPPLPENFPRRNELIVLLASVVVVVQAPERSGALYSAQWAVKHRRKLFAVPSPIDEPQGKGSNRLIAEAKAKPVWSIEDLFEHFDRLAPATIGSKASSSNQSQTANVLPFPRFNLNPQTTSLQPEQSRQSSAHSANLSEDARTLLDKLPPKFVHVDELALRTGFSTQRIMSALLELVFEGLVEEKPGQFYRRIDQKR